MNVYMVTAGIHDSLEEYIDDFPRYAPTDTMSVVAAPTRGKARSLFIQYWEQQKHYPFYFEWTDIKSVRLMDKRVDIEQGCNTDALWGEYDPTLFAPKGGAS